MRLEAKRFISGQGSFDKIFLDLWSLSPNFVWQTNTGTPCILLWVIWASWPAKLDEKSRPLRLAGTRAGRPTGPFRRIDARRPSSKHNGPVTRAALVGHVKFGLSFSCGREVKAQSLFLISLSRENRTYGEEVRLRRYLCFKQPDFHVSKSRMLYQRKQK